MRFRGVVVTLIALTTACSHGSRGTSTLPPVPGGSSHPAATMTVHLALTIPARGIATTTVVNGKRSVQYVSPSTLSGTVTVNGGAAQLFDLSSSSTLCVAVSGGRACSLSVAAPVGSDAFAITLYDSAYTGSPPTGNPLSAASNFAATIVEGQSNTTLPLILGGIPATATLTVDADPGLVASAPHNVPIIITAKDAQGNTIIGAAPYVNAGGAAVPIVVSRQLMPQINSNDPPFVYDGTSLGSATTASVAGPTDTLALAADAVGQAMLGAPIRIASGVPATVPAAYYHAPGPVGGSLPGFLYEGTFLGNGSNMTFAGPPAGTSVNYSLYAGSDAGWVANFSSLGASNWGALTTNTYCYPQALASVRGLAVAADGSFYATSQLLSLVAPQLGHYQLGPANAQCSSVGSEPIVSFNTGVNLTGGAIVLGNDVVYAINHATATVGTYEEVLVALPDLSQTAVITVPKDTTVYGLAGAVLDPTDNSLWIVSFFESKLIHISGTTGSPSSYAITGTYPLDPSCAADGIVSDGKLLYISCVSRAEILTVDPASPGTYDTLGGAAAACGSVAQWQDIAFGPDGFLWLLTSATTIQKFSTTSGASIASFGGGSNLKNVVAGGDGDLWIGSGSLGNYLARFAQGVGP